MKLNKHGPKRMRTTRRDWQKGRGGMTRHWLRADWFRDVSSDNPVQSWTGNKIARQAPVWAMEEDGMRVSYDPWARVGDFMYDDNGYCVRIPA